MRVFVLSDFSIAGGHLRESMTGGWNRDVACVVIAESPQEVAALLGAEYLPSSSYHGKGSMGGMDFGTIYIPEDRFIPVDPNDAEHPCHKFLQDYKATSLGNGDGLKECRLPSGYALRVYREEKGYLTIQEVPFLRREPAFTPEPEGAVY